MYCKAQAVVWSNTVDKFEALGYHVAILSYDKAQTLAQFKLRTRNRLTLLADPESEMIRAFGVLNDRFPPGSPGYGVAHPIIFVINGDGVITRRFSKQNYAERPDVEPILTELRQR